MGICYQTSHDLKMDERIAWQLLPHLFGRWTNERGPFDCAFGSLYPFFSFFALDKITFL
jgi:hypothetical protein